MARFARDLPSSLADKASGTHLCRHFTYCWDKPVNSLAPQSPYSDPAFVSTPNAKILVVMLHSFSSGRETLADLIGIVREKLGDAADIFAPTLPYGRPLDSSGAGATVVNLVG